MIESIVISMVLGAVAGFLAGLLGIGGGLVIVPALVGLFGLQGFPPKLIMLMALATSLGEYPLYFIGLYVRPSPLKGGVVAKCLPFGTGYCHWYFVGIIFG